jgi:hypothetical protein
MESNALEGADIVVVPAGTYDLVLDTPDTSTYSDDASTDDIDITDHIVIRGASAETTVIDASQLGDRVFSVHGARFDSEPLQIEFVGLTLRDGWTSNLGGCVFSMGNGTATIRESIITGCSTDGFGGGFAHLGSGQVGRVVIVDSTITGNRAAYGGGLFENQGTLEVVRSTISANRTDGPTEQGGYFGAGIYQVIGHMNVVDSVIVGNVSFRSGGGIAASQTAITVDRTSIVNNEARNPSGLDRPQEGTGGGIWLERCPLTMTNSTVSGNIAPDAGAGIFSERGGRFEIAFSTITDNRTTSTEPGAGFNILQFGVWASGTSWVRGTIIAGNLADGVESNCFISEDGYMPYESHGFNLDGDGSCVLTDSTDLISVDPGLEPLGDNGGLGPSHALVPGSAAVDAIPEDECLFLIDNDHDGQVDEDPIDGLDNDNDWRWDEDPPEVADVDQRGAARPSGAACDIGAYELSTDPVTVIEELIDDVQAIIEAGEINYGRGRSLIAELQVALWFLDFNNGERIAVTRIELFIIKVERLIDKGELDEELGNDLLVKARAVLQMLEEASG